MKDIVTGILIALCALTAIGGISYSTVKCTDIKYKYSVQLTKELGKDADRVIRVLEGSLY